MAFLRFMGEDEDAKGYGYSLEVGGNGRKLIWQGVPRSIRDGHRKVRDSHDGLIIHRKMALFFSGGNRQELKLRVTGRIWKEQWPRPNVEYKLVQASIACLDWVILQLCHWFVVRITSHSKEGSVELLILLYTSLTIKLNPNVNPR